MRLGVNVRYFRKRLPVVELARMVSGIGFKFIQLPLPDVISDIDTSLGRLSPGMANYIKGIFCKYGIQIAVIECFINPVHPDKDERKRQIEMFKECIRYARDFGCSIVTTETGSLNTDFSYNRDNYSEKTFQILLSSLNEMVNEAEKFGIVVCFEGCKPHTAHSPERIRKILDKINSNNLQVLFDPVNLLIEDYKNQNSIQNSIIKESFDLFGDRIIAVHAKDFMIENGCFKIVQAGKGIFNYELFFELLKAKKPYIYIFMENIDMQTIDEGISYLEGIYNIYT